MGHVANGPLYPIDKAPVIVSDNRNFVSEIKPVNGQPLTFTISGLIHPKTFSDLKLIPFFEIHRARYMIYWPVMTPDSLEKKTQAIHEKEKELLALEARTVDQVATGEQQPETEHHFKGEGTESGIHEGKFWRHARGWFSYDLKDLKKESRMLRITYYGLDRDRQFDICLNDTVFATVNLDGSAGNKFFDVDYPIPKDLIENTQNDLLNVKFVAHPGSIAGGIYYVRLLK